MKVASLLFYAVGCFTLGAITYLLAVPIAQLGRLSDPTGGLASIISYVGVGIMFVGPVLFLIEAVMTSMREARRPD